MKKQIDWWSETEQRYEQYSYSYPDDKELLDIFLPEAEKIIERELDKNIRKGGKLLSKETLPYFKKCDELKDDLAKSFWKQAYFQEAGWYKAISKNIKRLRRLKSLVNPSESFKNWENKKELAKQKPIQEIFEPKKIQRSSKGFKCICPLHSENFPSFNVYQDNTWHCFGCNVGGDSIDLVMRLHSLPMVKAVNYLVGVAQ